MCKFRTNRCFNYIFSRIHFEIINCSGFIGDSGMATTPTHGLVSPKVNRSATPSFRNTFYHII